MTGWTIRKLVWALAALVAACFAASPASAANCYYATSQGGTGPADWQTYCWLDLTSYNNTTATSGAGQNFSYTLPDGTLMTFNMKVTGTGLNSAAAPSWTGAAVGNTAFLGITGRPILYQNTDGVTNTVTISNIVLTPPASGTITNYMFVAADGESSNGGETLRFQTNGGNWQMLGQIGPTSGSTYPTYSGIGSNNFLVTGVAGTVGAYIVGSTTPTQITTTLVGSGLQGAMFAVRFASIRLNTQITGTRIAAADQFTFTINTTGTGSLLATGTSTGTGLGPFTAAALSSSAAIPITLNQSMASGSTNTLSNYRSSLTCTNSASTSTPLPSNVVTTSYSFGAMQFGDAIQCTFTEAAYPRLRLTKVLVTGFGGGRQFTGDQFVMNIKQGSTTVATTTTTGTGSTVNNGSTPWYQGAAGTVYTLTETGSGSTAVDQYDATMSCTNLWTGSSTVLPTIANGGTVTPQLGDVISCTITNDKKNNNAKLSVIKISQPISDPVRGTTNPLMIPGAIVRYTLSIQNSGEVSPDNNSILIVDKLPANLAVGTSASPTFTQGTPTSGLSLNTTTGVKYSNSATQPTSITACTYNPVSAYDPAVKYVCIRPTGTMAVSAGTPPNFSITIQGQIK